MNIKIFDALEDKNNWLMVLEKLKIENDIFYDPDYIKLFLSDDSKANLFVVEHEDRYWINCFIKKSQIISV